MAGARQLIDASDAERLVGIAFDFALDLPLRRFVDLSTVLEHADHVLSESVTKRVIDIHISPFLDRERTRAQERDDSVGDWLTPNTTTSLRSLAGRPVRLSKAFLEELVEQQAVRDMLRTMVTETLDRFVQTLSPSGRGGGLLGSLGRGAVGFGKGLLRGLSKQLETQLKKASRSFVESSLNVISARLVDYLSNPRTAKQIGNMVQTGFDQALELKTLVIVDTLREQPIDDILALAPELLIHNLGREDVRGAILQEFQVALDLEGERSLRALLDDADAVALWRAELVKIGAPLLTELAATDAFTSWFESVTKT